MAQEPTPGTATSAQSQSLYRKYRPTSFDPSQLVGQEHVARTLRNAIVLDRVAHAYLFCGPRGTGKTSTARLLAKAVNCQADDPTERPCNQCESCLAINSGSVVDIIEIDAASNRGVDDIRDLREKVRYAPTQLAVKFYIIDEAHQLTRDAFNAFLKTLEEPPDHVKFVLATTEAEKLPDTVASRCQRFDFRRIPVESTLQHLRNVSQAEEIEAEEEALLLIARHATGSLRDALGLLDQLALYGDQESDKRVLTAETVRQVLGLSHNERLVGLVKAIADRDAGEGLRLITEATDSGEDIHQLNRQMIGYLRLLLHVRAGGKPPEADDVVSELAQQFSLEQLSALVRSFTEVDAASNRSSYPQLPLELALVRAIVGDPATAPLAQPEQQTPPPPPNRPAASESTSRSRKDDTRPETTRNRTQSKPPAEPASQPDPAPKAEPRARQPARPTNGMLEHLVANWSHIRRDVKAENSRIAALLSSADPAAVTSDAIILAAPYEFHRNKLNEDGVREVIERVLQQYSHTEHRMICMAPEDVPDSSSDEAVGAETSAPDDSPGNGTDAASDGTTAESKRTTSDPEGSNDNSSNGVAVREEADDDPDQYNSDEVGKPTEAAGSSDDPEDTSDEERVEAAKRIFEAREID